MIQKPMLRNETLLQPVKYKGGGDLTLDELKMQLEKACEEHGLDVIISTDLITSGKLFDRSTTECIVIKNAEHQSDYFYEVVTLKTQGLYAFIDFYYSGTSKNNRRVAEGNKKHETLTGTIIGAIKKATVSDDAMESETFYYSMLADAISSIFE